MLTIVHKVEILEGIFDYIQEEIQDFDYDIEILDEILGDSLTPDELYKVKVELYQDKYSQE
jgi:hypothetical protein